jgi:hypothetical protein
VFKRTDGMSLAKRENYINVKKLSVESDFYTQADSDNSSRAKSRGRGVEGTILPSPSPSPSPSPPPSPSRSPPQLSADRQLSLGRSISGVDRGKNVQSTKRVARGEIGICGTSEVAANGRAAVVVEVQVGVGAGVHPRTLMALVGSPRPGGKPDS